MDRNVKLIGSDGIYKQAFVNAAGDAAEGTYVTFPGVPPFKTPQARALSGIRHTRLGYETVRESYASNRYEATRVVLQAIERAGQSDRSKVRDEAFELRSFAGILGTWSFDENGDTTLRDIPGLRIKGGRIDPTTAEAIPCTA